MEQRRWAGSTFGNGWMHGQLIRVLRHIDVRILYVFAGIFIVPVCLLINPSRRTAYSFYHNKLGYGRFRAARATYRNHYMFATAIIDRFAMYAGKNFNVRVEGLDVFNGLAEGEDGFVQLSSHIGNYEIAGYSLVSDRKAINAVVFAGEKASVMENRNSMFVRTNIRMIPVRTDMSHLFEINNALAAGEIVSFPADRHMGDSRRVECMFLGEKAEFPQGPFSTAAMRGLDVIAVNVMKERNGEYTIYVTPLRYDRNLPRKEQIRQLSEAYVAELEKRVRQYPEQWYNFFDFWK